MEPPPGVGPGSQPYQGRILPLDHGDLVRSAGVEPANPGLEAQSLTVRPRPNGSPSGLSPVRGMVPPRRSRNAPPVRFRDMRQDPEGSRETWWAGWGSNPPVSAKPRAGLRPAGTPLSRPARSCGAGITPAISPTRSGRSQVLELPHTVLGADDRIRTGSLAMARPRATSHTPPALSTCSVGCQSTPGTLMARIGSILRPMLRGFNTAKVATAPRFELGPTGFGGPDAPVTPRCRRYATLRIGKVTPRSGRESSGYLNSRSRDQKFHRDRSRRPSSRNRRRIGKARQAHPGAPIGLW